MYSIEAGGEAKRRGLVQWGKQGTRAIGRLEVFREEGRWGTLIKT